MSRPTGRLTPGFTIAALAVVAFTVSCTEDPLALGPDSAPGTSTETRDVTLSVTDLPLWRDTTVTGFALPANASFLFLSNDPALMGRSLVRFNIPDTIRTFADTLPVDTFDSVNVLLRVDTIRSEFTDLPLTFRLVQLNQPFDADSVSWLEAAPGVPWTTPGGDLGVEIGSGVLEAMSDTVFLSLAVSEDSLLKAWQNQDGGDGVALLVEGSTSRIRLQQIVIRYQATLVGRDNPVSQTQQPDSRTFITDPSLPDTDEDLRLGGLPASRLYLDFAPPEELDGVLLSAATINHAELILHPLPAPQDPFAIELPLAVRQITLLADPFEFGAKTPIGSADGSLIGLSPDSLATGAALRLDITLLIARAVRDSIPNIRLGLRGDPDAQVLGFWEFGSIEALAAFRPQIRILYSPAAVFGIP